MSKYATYKILCENGVCVVETNVRWAVKRSGAKNCQHTGNRSGVIHTRARFKAWLKKYNLAVIDSEIGQIPVVSPWDESLT